MAPVEEHIVRRQVWVRVNQGVLDRIAASCARKGLVQEVAVGRILQDAVARGKP